MTLVPIRLAATATGGIFYSAGDIDAPYGIASLSKIWAVVLLYDRIRDMAGGRNISIDAVLDEPIAVAVDYEPMIYHRMAPRPDLAAPDDPLVYRPFRPEKMRFRLPVEKGKSYTARELFEATLFQSKNDAAQALADYFFAADDNRTFRAASVAMADKLGLTRTKIGDPHGLCDGDNVTTAREWAKFCGFLIQEKRLDFFASFDPSGKEHTAAKILGDDRLNKKNIRIVLAKTATGNDRHGNDSAASLMAIAKAGDHYKIALALSDADRFDSIADLLLKESR